MSKKHTLQNTSNSKDSPVTMPVQVARILKKNAQDPAREFYAQEEGEDYVFVGTPRLDIPSEDKMGQVMKLISLKNQWNATNKSLSAASSKPLLQKDHTKTT